MYKAAIFDVDGTLLYTMDDLSAALAHALGKYGYPAPDREAVRRRLGHGARYFVGESLPGGSDNPDLDEVLAEFSRYYGEHCAEKTVPFDGVAELLERLDLSGIMLAASSNKNEPDIKTLMDKWFPGKFRAIAGNVPGRPTKPSPEGLFHVLDTLMLRPDEAVYVGDSDTDVLTAKNGGLDCVSVTWGYRTREELAAAGAVRFADTAEELYAMITGE